MGRAQYAKLSKRISVPLVCASVFFALAFALLGILGTVADRSATEVGNDITQDELTTAIATAEVGHSMDMAYATGEEAFFQVPGGPLRAGLVASLNPLWSLGWACNWSWRMWARC